MKSFPERIPNRLKTFDYSRNGAYFITVCAKNREPFFSVIAVGTSIARPYEVRLTDKGKTVEKAIKAIPDHYRGVFVDHYVVMPNHIHMILRIERNDGRDSGRAMLVPTDTATVSRIIQQMKGYVSKQVGEPVWQEKFYDHIIRDDADYLARYRYIEDNPANWLLKKDEYYQ